MCFFNPPFFQLFSKVMQRMNPTTFMWKALKKVSYDCCSLETIKFRGNTYELVLRHVSQ